MNMNESISQTMIGGKALSEWTAELPVLEDLTRQREAFWKNPNKKPFDAAITQAELTARDVSDASARLRRFAPY